MKNIVTFILTILTGVCIAQPTIEWQKSLGGSDYDYAQAIQQTSDGGFIVAGRSYSNDGEITEHHGSRDSCDYWVVKLSPDPVSITENVLPVNFDLDIYSNPFNSNITINAPTGTVIEIYDLLGNMVMEKQTTKGSSMWEPNENAGSGIYLVRATNRNRAINTKV